MPRSTKILLWIVAVVAAAGLVILGYLYIPGRADISINDQSAKIMLDGADWQYKKTIWLKRGQHSIEADKDGCLTATDVFTIKPILSTSVTLQLNKLATLSPESSDPNETTIDELASQRIGAAGSDNYIFLDEAGKAVMKFSAGEATIILDLPFLSSETLDHYKFSADFNQLFIRSFIDDKYSSRLINLADQSTKDLGADIVDVAFGTSKYYTLKNPTSGSVIFDKGGQIAQISETKNNLDYDGSNFYLYNKVGDQVANEAFYCKPAGGCNKFTVSGDIVELFAAGGHAVTITLNDNYSLYDISGGESKQVNSDIAPLGTWFANNFYYQKNGDTCSINKYDFSSSAFIYQNANICDIDDFSIASNKLFFRQGLTAYEMELK